MSFLHYLLQAKRKSADVARERLQVIVAHERASKKLHDQTPDFLPDLQRELIAVLVKYFPVDPMDVKVHLEQGGDYDVLELNVPILVPRNDNVAS
jgi:cell division topological specificity factor